MICAQTFDSKIYLEDRRSRLFEFDSNKWIDFCLYFCFQIPKYEFVQLAGFQYDEMGTTSPKKNMLMNSGSVQWPREFLLCFVWYSLSISNELYAQMQNWWHNTILIYLPTLYLNSVKKIPWIFCDDDLDSMRFCLLWIKMNCVHMIAFVVVDFWWCFVCACECICMCTWVFGFSYKLYVFNDNIAGYWFSRPWIVDGWMKEFSAWFFGIPWAS